MATEFTATETTQVASNNVLRKAITFSVPVGPGTLYILCQDEEPEDTPSATNHDLFVPAGQLLTLGGEHWKGSVWAAFSEADSSALIRVYL